MNFIRNVVFLGFIVRGIVIFSYSCHINRRIFMQPSNLTKICFFFHISFCLDLVQFYDSKMLNTLSLFSNVYYDFTWNYPLKQFFQSNASLKSTVLRSARNRYHHGNSHIDWTTYSEELLFTTPVINASKSFCFCPLYYFFLIFFFYFVVEAKVFFYI